LTNGSGLSAQVIGRSQEWPAAGHIGYVIGATYPAELQTARQMAPGASFLIPGIGAQGGSLEAAVRFGPDTAAGPIISASRSVIYASSGADFAEAARNSAENLRRSINQLRSG